MATVPSFAAFRSSNLGGGTGTPGENIGHGDSPAEAISRASNTHPHVWIKHPPHTPGSNISLRQAGKTVKINLKKKKNQNGLYFFPPYF